MAAAGCCCAYTLQDRGAKLGSYKRNLAWNLRLGAVHRKLPVYQGDACQSSNRSSVVTTWFWRHLIGPACSANRPAFCQTVA